MTQRIIYVLFALMQMGNPVGLRKKDQARPEAPPAGQTSGPPRRMSLNFLLFLFFVSRQRKER
jgi:hypothetical protein